LLGIVTALFASPTPVRGGTTITVNTAADGAPADDGVCTLREAIIAANDNTASGATGGECAAGGSGTDTIEFSAPYAITLDPAQGSLMPSSDIVMYGFGTGSTIVEASSCDPTPEVPGCTTATYPVFQATGSHLQFEDMTVRFGANAANGGGIYVNGPVFETYNVLFWHNLAGYGGGIYVQTGGVTLHESTLEGNRATGDGGGIYNKGALDINRSTVSNNVAAGEAGGIWQDSTGTGMISNSTVTGNDADSKGGLYNRGAVGIYNSTFVYNTDQQTSPFTPVGGIYNYIGAHLGLSNVLLANNAGFDCQSDPFAYMDANVGSLIENNATAPWNCSTPAVASDPGPMDVGNHGGFTDTATITGSSPAYGAGDVSVCNNFPIEGWDQRWRRRKVGRCDIGAYELPQTPTDFQPDGKTEAAKYVPAAGAVYYYDSGAATWGSSFIGPDGYYVINSDFDGDGRTDPAKYVASAGAVWYLGSSDSLWHGVYVGSDGEYIPASDFDGDGKTDPAKYVAAAGAVWYFGSADSTWYGLYIGSLGGGGYLPGSDFDGDGATDPAHIDTSGNVWYLGSTDSTVHGLYIGTDGDYIERSDYDGDGVTDAAKFVSPNIWYLQSNNSYNLASIPLGADVAFVVPGSDFDGDGITDPAKYVATAQAIWYTRSSDAGSVGVYMGDDTYVIVN